MASKDTMDLELWLSELLNSVGVDGEVYGGYISGTLATMEGSSQSEMEEALVDILTGCVVSVLSLTVLVLYIVPSLAGQTLMREGESLVKFPSSSRV